MLARISHQVPTAAGDAPHSAVFSRLGVLNGLLSTPPRPSGRKPHWARHLTGLATNPGEICGLVRVIAFLAFLPAFAAVVCGQERIDITRWHEEHPVGLADENPDRRLRLGLYPRLGAVIGVPNGLAGTFQISLSLRRPERYSLYVGAGYEYGPAVEGGNLTLGWGGVREAPATVLQRGFSGAFLRYRNWDSDDHGRHHGLSVGVESGLGAFGLVMEAGLARSDRNHWMPVARLSFSVGHAWLWVK